jgi:predicted DNA-binding helix-hairpin-helix protein
MRDYGFAPDEVVYGANGNLPLAQDPKTAWALQHPEAFPVEITTAGPEELRRVPGIGPLAAQRITAERTRVSFRGLADLRRLGVVTNRAGGFLTLRGRPLDRATGILGGGGRCRYAAHRL